MRASKQIMERTEHSSTQWEKPLSLLLVKSHDVTPPEQSYSRLIDWFHMTLDDKVVGQSQRQSVSQSVCSQSVSGSQCRAAGGIHSHCVCVCVGSVSLAPPSCIEVSAPLRSQHF